MVENLLELLSTIHCNAYWEVADQQFFKKCAFRKEFITLDSAKTTQLEAWLVDENCMYPTIIYALTRLLLSTVLGPEFVNSMFRAGGNSGVRRKFSFPCIALFHQMTFHYCLPLQIFWLQPSLLCDKTNHEIWYVYAVKISSGCSSLMSVRLWNFKDGGS